MYHLDRPMYLLGYIANQSRVYLVDKEFKYVPFFCLFISDGLIAHSKYADVFHLSWECSVIGYTLLLSLIEYKTLVMRGDLDKANEILPTIPKEQHNKYVISYFSLNFNIYIFNMYRNSSPTVSYVLRDVIFRFQMVFVVQFTKNIVILVSLRCL